MRAVNKISIRSKLPIAMATMVALNIILISAVGYFDSRDLAVKGANEKLAEIGDTHAKQVEALLHSVDHGLQTQAADPVVAEAITAFAKTFNALQNPKEDLQKDYITDNPFPAEDRGKLRNTSGFSPYDTVHRQYHPIFATLRDAVGYYDVFLFDTRGNLVYSVQKSTDYATNLMTGEWRETGLAEAFRQASENSADARSVFVDFAPYGPSGGKPEAFIARPVFDTDGARLGVIAYELPVSALNAAASTSIGRTGHSYLVAADGYMRSDTPLTEVNDVLQTFVESPAVEHGTAGETGTLEYHDAAGNVVEGHYNAIDFHGVSWALVTEQGQEELLSALPKMLRDQLMMGAAFLAVAAALSFWLASGVSRPLQRVVDTVGRISGKDYDTPVPDIDRGDEIGDIAQALERFRTTLAEAEEAAVDAAFKGAAYDATGGPMALCDLDRRCVGANAALLTLIAEHPDDFGIEAEEDGTMPLVGRTLEELDIIDGDILAEMQDHARLPIQKTIVVGGLYVGLLIDLVRNREGGGIGYVIDMQNRTDQMAAEVLSTAIDGQQSRVEMDLSGAVKRHNDHFARLLRLDARAVQKTNGREIIRGEAQGAEIWDAALRGEATVGRFHVAAQQGRRIVDGSFNPVPDQDGRTAGFLLIGVDVTEERERAIAAESEAKQRADDQANVVQKLSVSLQHISQGDLTSLIEDTFAQDYEQLRHDFNEAVSKLEAVIGDVVVNASSIGSEAGGISASVTELSKRTEAQAATLEETAAAMHQLTTSVASSAQGAASAAEIAAEARKNAQASSGIVRETADAMTQIEASSQEVAKIIGVIDDIAFQTNLLALNAGVEAARAGSAGRGFAVVASEVRALAQRCLEASNDISSLISASGEHVERGVSLVGKTGNELENIAASVLEISDNVGQIATAAREQSNGLTEINEALSQLDQATQQNAAMAEETTAAAQSLLGEAHHLTETTSSFRTRRSSEQKGTHRAA
ncbi:MAG: methyl-accepting chemotaxis protein [Silicimonas sp.]|nr:methyl-accepting chemotaxis protein [Silicimonas sp.]